MRTVKTSTTILIAVIALIVGHVSGYAFAGNKMHGNANNVKAINQTMQSSMDGMMSNLQGKTGDEFDKAFLNEMIMHHEGAVVMAKSSLQNVSG